MPLVKPINDIKDAITYYHSVNSGPVELNFTLIEGLNDTELDAEQIINTFPNEYIKISQFNPTTQAPQFKASTHYDAFVAQLRDAGLTVEYHATDGSKIGAACGQTRGEFRVK